MFKKYSLLCITLGAGILLPMQAIDNPLVPGVPVTVVETNNVFMPTTVAGTTTGFMTMAVGNDSLISNFSTNHGTSWSSPTTIFENAFLPMWVSGNSQGFMATWIVPLPGYTTAAPVWSFSTDQGASWSEFNPIAVSSSIYSPIVVSGTEAGFMATFRDSDNNAYASFTSNNGASWNSPINISSSGCVNSAALVSGTPAGFMATWQETDHSAHAAFSVDGTTWSAPSTIINNGTVFSDVWVAGNSTGFMATWEDGSGNGYSSFSSDNGLSWSSPVLITPNVLNTPTDVSVTGATSGFVAAWIGTDNNAYGSFFANGGSSWTTPVQITGGGNVIGGNVSGGANGYGFMDVTAVGDNVMFAWLENSNNTFSSFASLSGSPVINPPTDIEGNQKKNNFGLLYELYNTVQWHASSSVGVEGYYIYRDGILLATVTASTTVYKDHNQPQGVAIEYGVAAFDSQGNISTIATIIID